MYRRATLVCDAFSMLFLAQNPSLLQRFLSRADLNDNEMIDLPEFMHYVLEHEKNVKVVFDSVDKNQDGIIDQNELRAYMKSIGIDLSDDELTALYTRIDTNNSKSISLEEFQNYLLFCPEVSDVKVLINYWRHNLVDCCRRVLGNCLCTEHRHRRGFYRA